MIFCKQEASLAFSALLCRAHEGWRSCRGCLLRARGGDAVSSLGGTCVDFKPSKQPGPNTARVIVAAQHGLPKLCRIMHASCFLKLAAHVYINMQIKQLQIKQKYENVYSLSSVLWHN